MLRRRIITPRFKFPMTKEQTKDCILGAIQAEVAYRHRTFCMNECLKEQIDQMAKWLTSDNSKFGMLLCGGCGNGKSTMVKAFQQLLNFLFIPNKTTGNPYAIRIVDAKYIVQLYRTNYKQWLDLTRADMLAIDDLGIEPLEVLDYGNVISPVVDLLTRRYEEQLFTIITSNLTPPQISNTYGERIADRLREMMERITYANPSYRIENET